MSFPRLFFIIQAHVANEQLDWLLGWLGSEGDTRFLSMDCETEGHEFKGVHVQRSPSVTWGGYSQVSVYLQSLQQALAFPDWDYIINLSGACFPTKPLRALKQFLEPRCNMQVSLIAGVRTAVPVLSGVSSFYQPTYVKSDMLKTRNVELYCEKDIEPTFRVIDESPVFRITDRINYHVEELSPAKSLLVRQLEADEVDTRRKLLQNTQLHFGRAWYCLHRTGAQTVVESAASSRSLGILKHSFEPDELFMQTLVFGKDITITTENRNLHAWWGAPSNVDASRWLEAATQDSFFARKVSPWNFESVLDASTGHI